MDKSSRVSTNTYDESVSTTGLLYGRSASWSEIEDIESWIRETVRRTAYEWDIALCEQWISHLHLLLIRGIFNIQTASFKPKIKVFINPFF